MKVWLDGELVDEAAARISPFDHGLLTGDGVFETLRVYGGVPFAWRRHLDRLAASAAALGLPLPDRETLRSAADAVLASAGLPDARLRITVTGGVAPPGSARGDGPPTVLVAAAPLDPLAASVRVAVAPWPRNERGALTGVKSISYAENVRALAWARARGADEAVFANTRGDLCEGTGTNLFLVEDGAVVTPPPSDGCLEGVTRGLVLQVAATLGVPSKEESRPVEAAARADEAFLTSTTREVQAISRIDDTGLAAPGPVTERLAEAFGALVREDPDP